MHLPVLDKVMLLTLTAHHQEATAVVALVGQRLLLSARSLML